MQAETGQLSQSLTVIFELAEFLEKYWSINTVTEQISHNIIVCCGSRGSISPRLSKPKCKRLRSHTIETLHSNMIRYHRESRNFGNLTLTIYQGIVRFQNFNAPSQSVVDKIDEIP